MGLYDADTKQVTVPSETQKIQASILKELAPYLTQYYKTGMEGLGDLTPMLNQLLQQAAGGSTTIGQKNYANTIGQMKETAGQMGINAGDPRMVRNIYQAGENLTKGNLPELQTIMQLYGISPSQTLNTMGGGSPASVKQTTDNTQAILTGSLNNLYKMLTVM